MAVVTCVSENLQQQLDKVRAKLSLCLIMYNAVAQLIEALLYKS